MSLAQSKLTILEDLTPENEFWKQTTYKNFHESNQEFDEFIETLNPIETKTLDIIENINSLVSFGINFTSKQIGFDEITKSYLGHVTSIDENEQESQIIKIKRSSNEFQGKPVLGVCSFVRFPGGFIEYHKRNKTLFNLSTIALMLDKCSFPIHFIKELNTAELLTIRRTGGQIQESLIPDNISIIWSESKSYNDGYKWRVQVTFNDQKGMDEESIKLDNERLVSNGSGLFVKTINLTDIMINNNIEKLTLESTKLKMSLKEDDINEQYVQEYGSDTSESENGAEEGEQFSSKLFVDKNSEPDVILNSYHNIIVSDVSKYFEKRFDEYILCVKKSMVNSGINVSVV